MELLAGTADGIYRLDGGTAQQLADGDATALTVDGDAVWAIIDRTVLTRGTAAGGFTPVAEGDRALRCLLPTGAGLLVGTAEAGLDRLDGGQLTPVGAFGEVPGRDGWYTPWGAPPDTRSLAASRDGTLYVNVHVGGIARSRDGGATWEPTIDVDDDVHQVLAADDFLLAATAFGLAVSDDRGASWHWRTDGLHATYARAVAVVDGSVLVSVSQGPGGGQAAICRGALDLDGPLMRCHDGLPEWFSGNVNTHCLVAGGQAVAAADQGAVYHSADSGGSWTLLADDLPPVRCLAPVVAATE